MNVSLFKYNLIKFFISFAKLASLLIMKQYDDFYKPDMLDRHIMEKFLRDGHEKGPYNERNYEYARGGTGGNGLLDNARLYVTIKRSPDSNQEYKKLILMVPSMKCDSFV